MNKTTLSQKRKAQARPLTIAVVGIALIVLLIVVVYFVGFRSAGQAVFTQDQGVPGTAGFRGQLSDLQREGSFQFPVAAHLGSAPASEVYFELQFPSAFSVDPNAIQLQLPFGEGSSAYLRREVIGNKLIFHHATLDPTKTISGSDIAIVTIPFTVVSGVTPTEDQLQQIQFVVFTIPNLNPPHDNIIQLIKNPVAEQIACLANDETCQPWFNTNQGTLCQSWLGSLDQAGLNQKLTDAQKAVLCTDVGSRLGYTVDINGDTKIDGQDAFIVLKIAEAKVREECGNNDLAPCNFAGTRTCDDGSFRVDSYKEYVFDVAHTCPYSDTAAYISGGQLR